jgi:N-acetylmuramoyl-L-alanine amidase
MTKLIQRPSPNFNSRRVPVDCVVLHSTADSDTEQSVEWCCDRASKVSYHTIVDRDGTVFALVDTDKRAWHAGVSSFEGRGNVNDFSIGLSFGNDNEGEAVTDVQYAVGAALVAGYIRKYPAITIDRITMHKTIALPAGRKTDPAPPFDLPRFLEAVQGELDG